MTTPRADACQDWQPMLHAFHDGELDSEHCRRVEQHLSECAACRADYAGLQAMRRLLHDNAPRYPASPALNARIVSALAAEAVSTGVTAAAIQPLPTGIRHRLSRLRDWSLPASLIVLAASLAIVLAPLPGETPLQRDLVDAHVHSLLADHLTDVATSDQHTVKPWFNGRLDFAPPVVDLAESGFALIGGRLDYLGGRVAAALVYRRQGHVINVFIRSGGGRAPAAGERDGYHLIGWQDAGLDFQAVSDLNAQDLGAFQRAFRTATAR